MTPCSQVNCPQARYRQRQREKMDQLEEEVTSLKAQVADLKQANEALRQQGSEAGQARWDIPCTLARWRPQPGGLQQIALLSQLR